MTLRVETIICGPLENNVYVVYEDATREAIVIDPSIGTEKVATFINKQNLDVRQILITHAHFDHFYGVPYLLNKIPSIQTVLLHELDHLQWESGGGAKKYIGVRLQVEAPLRFVKDAEFVTFEEHSCEVRLAPGHSAGSVLYYFSEINCAFVGDVIFFHGVGRTDLEDGNSEQLLESIRRQVFSLPDETVLYPGHGPATTVREEKSNNPFL
jgi:glyoxylase-like metal-dependent hydrolase (beta-lactamase superfamily II)